MDLKISRNLPYVLAYEFLLFVLSILAFYLVSEEPGVSLYWEYTSFFCIKPFYLESDLVLTFCMKYNRNIVNRSFRVLAADFNQVLNNT